MEQTFKKDPIRTLTAVAMQLPWPERLKVLASLLQYPTVYGDARDELMQQIKLHPEATELPQDFWTIVEWLNRQPGVDLNRPPDLQVQASDDGKPFRE
jgi:hypothetical protein